MIASSPNAWMNTELTHVWVDKVLGQGPYNSGKTWKTQGIFFTQGKPGKLREFRSFSLDSGKTQGIS